MLNLKEGHINLSDKWIVFPLPKEKNKPKFINLLPEHIGVILEVQNMVPAALPDMFFFRHLKTKSGVKAGVEFGPKYFNKWWKKACKNLGIEGVSVYPGVKHSTWVKYCPQKQFSMMSLAMYPMRSKDISYRIGKGQLQQPGKLGMLEKRSRLKLLN